MEQGRLAGEPGTPYHYRYAYDPLGNRTRETDLTLDRYTVYEYDTDYADPNMLGLTGETPVPPDNRLLSYRVYGPCLLPPFHELVRTVRYTYYQNGDVAHITVYDVGGDKSHDLYLNYSTTGTLWLALWQEWPGEAYPGPNQFTPWDPNSGDAVTDAWEFRYDTGRQRYLTRQLGFDPRHLDWFWPIGEDRWTDYLGEQPYVDYAVTGWEEATPRTRYLAGLGIHGQESVAAGGTGVSPVRYFHGDLIDSTMLLTDESGQVADPGAWSYTAFGNNGGTGAVPERELGVRYGYAGGYGYETGLLTLTGTNPALPAITLLHVGARWYQPGIGRFVQRDPIGILGGLNVYAYCASNPLNAIDPAGLDIWRPGVPEPPPPRLYPVDQLPTDKNGWIKIPPGQRPSFDPKTRKFRLVPRTPPPAAPSLCAKLWLLIQYLGRGGLGPSLLPPVICPPTLNPHDGRLPRQEYPQAMDKEHTPMAVAWAYPPRWHQPGFDVGEQWD